jgi:hypothetical protein
VGSLFVVRVRLRWVLLIAAIFGLLAPFFGAVRVAASSVLRVTTTAAHSEATRVSAVVPGAVAIGGSNVVSAGDYKRHGSCVKLLHNVAGLQTYGPPSLDGRDSAGVIDRTFPGCTSLRRSRFGYDAPVHLRETRAAMATKACSFGGETLVLMADGTTKPISKIRPGDMVLAQDPETGEIGARKVTDAWVHDDDLVRLEIDGDIVRTTEDHPFWNDTDQQWQRADQLDSGDVVLTADGRRVKVGVLIGSAGRGSAYNFTVEGLHTYHVLFGDDAILVHNACSKILGRNLGAKPFDGAGAHHLVPGGGGASAEARAILSKHGIGIDDAANGVWLAEGSHIGTYTNAYRTYVNETLRAADRAGGRAGVVRALAELRDRLAATNDFSRTVR